VRDHRARPAPAPHRCGGRRTGPVRIRCDDTGTTARDPEAGAETPLRRLTLRPSASAEVPRLEAEPDDAAGRIHLGTKIAEHGLAARGILHRNGAVPEQAVVPHRQPYGAGRNFTGTV